MRKYIRALGGFFIAVIILLIPLKISALADDARELRGGDAAVQISGGAPSGALRDGLRDSFIYLAGGSEITISSATPFQTIYLIWDKIPGDWTLEAGAATFGRSTGFLHEAVLLEEATDTAVVRIGEAGAALCEIYVFSEGDLPDWVQVWEPILDRADLLVLPTHADDEHLFFGGILPTYAGEMGLRVQVVYMTNHWDDRVRPHEQLDGLWTVGVRNYPLVAEFPDLYASKESLAAAEYVYGRETILEFQVGLLRRFRPLVVVGHDLNGEYGHGAHILNAMTLREALELSGDAAQYPKSAEKYGVWDVPKCYLHLYEENQLVIEWDEPLERFGGRTGFDMAVEGFSKHVSQMQYFSVQRGGTWQDCRKFGLLRSTVGADSAGNTDLFENIVIELEPTPTPEPAPTEPPATEMPPATATPTPAETASAEETAPPDEGELKDARTRLYLLVILGILAVIAVAAALIRRRR